MNRFGDLGEFLGDTQEFNNDEFLSEWGDYARGEYRDFMNDSNFENLNENNKTRNKDGILGLISNLNKEDILLIALLYILYEEGADKITLMAIAYILLS